jgi:hypothetical protein
MNSTYAPNSQPRIPTWVCQGHVVTTDLPTLGTNPNSKQHGCATQEEKDLGNLQSLGWTVRMEGGLSTGARQTVCKLRADHPKMPPEPPVLHLKKRTISALPADHPCGRDRLHSPRRPSDKLRATKNTRQNGSKQRDTRTREERDELLPGRLLADRPPGACGPSAWCADSSPSSTSWRSTPPSLCPISPINQGIATKS